MTKTNVQPKRERKRSKDYSAVIKVIGVGGGGGNAGLIVEEPDLLSKAKSIIESLGGWHGPVNLEFKQHSKNGEFYLMEINCRLNGYSYLTSMNGLNFPAAIIDLLSKNDTPFLSFDNIKKHSNFIMAFREKPIPQWKN